jgi:hypothetical protein
MTRLSKFLLLTSLFAVVFLLVFGAEAQAAIVNPVIGDLGTNEGTADGSKFINYTVYLWRTSINLGALAVIGFFIWGAFEWLTAGGDTKKTETARTRITNAVIGLVIMVASFTILSFVSKLFFGQNFDLLRLTFPTRSTGSSTQNEPVRWQDIPEGWNPQQQRL